MANSKQNVIAIEFEYKTQENKLIKTFIIILENDEMTSYLSFIKKINSMQSFIKLTTDTEILYKLRIKGKDKQLFFEINDDNTLKEAIGYFTKSKAKKYTISIIQPQIQNKKINNKKCALKFAMILLTLFIVFILFIIIKMN